MIDQHSYQTILCLLLIITSGWLTLAQAATPPGLPRLTVERDPFSIPIWQTRRQAILKETAVDIKRMAISGTEKFFLPLAEPQGIYGFSISADIAFFSDVSTIKVILVDDQTQQDYLVYETYSSLVDQDTLNIAAVCEESCMLPYVESFSLRIELEEAEITLHKFSYTDVPPPLMAQEFGAEQQSLKQQQDQAKIERINTQNLGWIAGQTEVSALSYEEKKKLFLEPEVPNLYGFEYYQGGVFEIKSDLPPIETTTQAETTTQVSQLVDQFNWGAQHGENWVTPVKNQVTCGGCWAFSSIGVLEAVTNLYFNQHLDLDLSEQDLISCSQGGSCGGGLPGPALDYIANENVVDEACFTYSATDEPCQNKCTDAQDGIKTQGRLIFGSGAYPKTEDTLKEMLIHYGPMTGGIVTLRHGMVLVGFETDPTDNKTVWIFKNSWGKNWGGRLNNRWGDYHQDGYADNGYAYVKLDIDNLGWTYAVETPLLSTQPYQIDCVDKDNDHFCQWGLSPDKPATCPAFCKTEKDCNDADAALGPFEANYQCKLIGIPKKKQTFTVHNEGNIPLVIKAISPETEAPWISVEPVAFSVLPDEEQVVTVQVDYAKLTSSQEVTTRLLVSSNDTDNNPYPQGVHVVVTEQQPIQPAVVEPGKHTNGDSTTVEDPTDKPLPNSLTLIKAEIKNLCFKDTSFPCLGSAQATNAVGNEVTTATHFSGGIAINEGPFQSQATLVLSDSVKVQGTIFPNPEHIGQSVDLIVYAGYELSAQAIIYYMLDTQSDIYQWDEKIEHLVSFGQVTLTSPQSITLYQGNFLLPGTLHVFFGYRLADGTVIANEQAIDIEITPPANVIEDF
jgi:C1A family cysteine protease